MSKIPTDTIPSNGQIHNRYFSNDGVSQLDADINMNLDYSDTGLGVTDYYIECQEGEQLLVHRMNVLVEDAGSFDSGFYGNSIVLTNGIKLFWVSDGVREEVTTLIKKNPDWNLLAGVDVALSAYGTGNSLLNARITFTKMGGAIKLNPGDKLGVVLNDNLDGLVRHLIVTQGLKIDTT